MATTTQNQFMWGPWAFAAGIIIAIAGSAKVPAEQGGWPDTWPVFLLGAALAVAGIVSWRAAKSKQREAAPNAPKTAKDPLELLAGVMEPLRALNAEVDNLDADQICTRVEALLDGFVLPMAEQRALILERMGMESAAELLVIASYGERMLNRVWSTAADGHLPEARSACVEATAAFEEAVRAVPQEASGDRREAA